MCRIEIGLERLQVQPGSPTLRVQLFEPRPIRATATLFGEQLRVGEDQLSRERPLALLLLGGHRPGDVDAPAVEDVEQHARACPFCDEEGLDRAAFVDEQADEPVIGLQLGLEEALLLLFTAGHLAAERFDRGDRLLVGLPRARGLLQATVAGAGDVPRAPQGLQRAHLAGKLRGPVRSPQRFFVFVLLLVDRSEIPRRAGHPGRPPERFTDGERLLEKRDGLRIVACVLVGKADRVQSARDTVTIFEPFAELQALLEALDRLRMPALLGVEQSEVHQRGRNATGAAVRLEDDEALLVVVESLFAVTLGVMDHADVQKHVGGPGGAPVRRRDRQAFAIEHERAMVVALPVVGQTGIVQRVGDQGVAGAPVQGDAAFVVSERLGIATLPIAGHTHIVQGLGGAILIANPLADRQAALVVVEPNQELALQLVRQAHAVQRRRDAGVVADLDGDFVGQPTDLERSGIATAARLGPCLPDQRSDKRRCSEVAVSSDEG
jgi:hypothetical protein